MKPNRIFGSLLLALAGIGFLSGSFLLLIRNETGSARIVQSNDAAALKKPEPLDGERTVVEVVEEKEPGNPSQDEEPAGQARDDTSSAAQESGASIDKEKIQQLETPGPWSFRVNPRSHVINAKGWRAIVEIREAMREDKSMVIGIVATMNITRSTKRAKAAAQKIRKRIAGDNIDLAVRMKAEGNLSAKTRGLLVTVSVINGEK